MANKVILVGNLGKDPDLRYTPSGAAVATFSLATTERFKNSNGEKREETTWHNIVVWRKLAEICSQYLSKGSRVYLEGKIKNRSYEKDGEKKYISEVVIDQMEMLGSKPDTGTGEKTRTSDRDEPIFNPDDEIPF